MAVPCNQRDAGQARITCESRDPGLAEFSQQRIVVFLRALCEREGARILPRFSGIMMGIYDMRCRF